MRSVVDSFTTIISAGELDVTGIDIYDDAWGFSAGFYDVISMLSLAKPVPSDSLMKRLFDKIEDCDH